MKRKILKNKPLIEAIFELRWELKKDESGMQIDPHYKLIIGRLYEKFKSEYPKHEQLPSAKMPDEIASYIAQHRFRKEAGKWPLIQIGPGILTVNDTEGYIWEDFESRIIEAVNALFELYPDSEKNLIIDRLMLRYIDSIPFDFEKNDIFEFLKNQLKIKIDLYQKLFDETEVKKFPINFNLNFSFISTNPVGKIDLKFVSGKVKGIDALIWETIFKSKTEVARYSQEQIANWIIDAHNLTDDWFFKLIEGELMRRFE